MSSPFHDVLLVLREDLHEHLADVRLPSSEAVRAIGRRRQRRAVGITVVTGATAVALAGVSLLHAGTGGARPSTSTAPSACNSVAPPSHPGATAVIFFNRDATAAEIAAVRTRLGTLPYVKRVDFESRDQAFARFKTLTCSAPELVAATRPDNLPESLGVSTIGKGDYGQVKNAVIGLPGVDQVIPGDPQ